MRIRQQPLHQGDYIGMVAFSSIVLTCFAAFLYSSRISGEMWQLTVTFVGGALYGVLGVLCGRLIDDDDPRECWIYFGVQVTLVMAVVYLSPVRGFFGIIGLPLASQAVFLFRWKVSLPLGLGMYLATCFVFYPHSGWPGFNEALISYSAAYTFTVGFTFVTKNAVDMHLRSTALAAELEQANTQLRAHAEQAGELATTRERNRLAREIHDGVGHYLTVINVQAEAARSVLAKDPAQAASALEKVARLSREALEDVRRSVGTLRSDDNRPPLPEAVRSLGADAGLPVEIDVTGEPRSLSSAAEHALFRAAQEGLTNVRKHAQARSARVHLDFTDTARIRLSVADDGHGTPASSNGETTGFGLRGMRERIGLLGGRVESGPGPEGGFLLTVEVPA